MAEGTVKIKISADSSDAEKAVDSLKEDVEDTSTAASDSGDGAFEKLKSAATSAASTIAKTVTAAVTALGTTITALGTKAVEEYAEYEQMVGGIETLYGDAADTVMAYAEDAFSAAGLSANEYMEQATTYAAALVSSLGGDTEAAAEYANTAIEDMSDNANKMGTDMEDLENAYEGFSKSNYTMLDNLKLGYAGTQEGMQELIDDANDLKEAQGEVGDLTIDSYADIVEAIHLVQTEMGITGTTAEEAATTISGSISTLEAAWDNWLTGLGDDEADMGELTDDLITSLENVATNLAPVIAEIAESAVGAIGEALAGAVDAIEPALAEALTGIWNNVCALVSDWTGLELPQVSTEQVEGALDTAVQVLGAAWDTCCGILDTVVTTISSVLDGVMPLIDSFVSQLQNMGVGDAFSSIGESLGTIVEDIGEAVGALLEFLDQLGLGEVAATVFGAAIDAVALILQGLATFFDAVIEVVGTLATAFSTMGTNIQTTWQNLLTTAQTIWNTICEAILNFITNLVLGIQTQVTNIQTFWSNVWTTVQTVASTIWTGIQTTISTIITTISTTVSTILTGIQTTISNILNGISSTWSSIWGTISSTVSNIWSGIKSAVSSAIGNVYSSISGKMSSVKTTWSNAWTTMETKMNSIWTGIKSGVTSGISSVVTKVKTIKTKITDVFNNAKNWLKSAGQNICTGLVNGIKNGIDSVTGAIKDLCSTAISKAKSALGIGSPSKVFREIGGFTMEGLEIGLEDVAADAIGVVQTVADAMSGVFSGVDGSSIQLGLDTSGTIQTVQTSGTQSAGTEVTQNFEVKVVRSSEDLYTAVPTIVRSAIRSAS